jgi:hypothetical protein
MDDTSKVIVSFYSPDNTFENWWYYPEHYVSKLLNSKIKYVVGPDFSMLGGDPRTTWLHQLYRQRWLSRYMQESGIKLIPNVSAVVGDLEFAKNYVLGTLPVGLPMISCQMQTFNKEDIEILGLQSYIDHYTQYIEVLEPQGFLLYAGAPGQKFFNDHIFPKFPRLKVKILDSRLMRLSEFDNQRKRKPGI